MNFTCNECNDSGSRDKLGTYLDCNACGTAATRRDLNDFVKSLGPTHPEDVALAIHQRALTMAPKQEAQEPVAEVSAMPGTSGFTMAVFKADDMPIGSKVYAATAAANGAPGYAEKASPIAITDSSALNGIKWYVPPPEHLRNGMQLYFVAPQPVAAAGPDAALIESLEALLGLVDEFGIKSGVCCCGDDMARHSNPMDCGHSAVDSGQYYSEQTIEVARAALSGAKGN